MIVIPAVAVNSDHEHAAQISDSIDNSDWRTGLAGRPGKTHLPVVVDRGRKPLACFYGEFRSNECKNMNPFQPNTSRADCTFMLYKQRQICFIKG